MGMKTLFLFSVAVASVNGQFLNTEYRLDSAPLPIRRRINSADYEIQPSVEQEIEYSTETARISNQGRRHIDKNQKGNLLNVQTNRNVQAFEVKPAINYEIGDTIYENPQTNRKTSNVQQQVYREQYSARLQEQNNGDGYQNFNLYNGDSKLRTNLDSTTKLPPRRDLYIPETFPINHNIRINENLHNQQATSGIYEETIPNQQQSQFNLDKASQNQGDLPNYASDDIRNSENRNQPANANTRNYETNERKQNGNRRTETNQRAIDNSGYRIQQNIGSANRNYDSKPNRQSIETKKDKDIRNSEIYKYTTESIRRNTKDDRTVTDGTKFTEENELTSSSNPDRREEESDDDKRWIWMSSSNATDIRKTSIAPFIPTVDDRAAFDGDKCPAGQTRFNNICVDKH